MRILSLVTVAVVSLGGCASTGTISTTNVSSVIAQVQQAATQLCLFLPTAASVGSIVATLAPGATVTEQIVANVASQICAAVAPVKSATVGTAKKHGAYVPTVNGVVVHGRFL